MAIRLRMQGEPPSTLPRILGRVVFEDVEPEKRSDCFLGVKKASTIPIMPSDISGYSALLLEKDLDPSNFSSCGVPLIVNYSDLGFLSQNSILAINPDGDTRILYRPESLNNSLFATVRCNSNCLMCSQPPGIDSADELIAEHLRLIELIQDPPEAFGITGGEPTLLKDGLIKILQRLKERFPQTYVHLLTNGRLYAYEGFVRRIAQVGHTNFVSAIPLYSDVASEHDYIVQAKGAFDQTIAGILNAGKSGLRIEIRVVLHKQTLPRLLSLCEFFFRNLPFAEHIALMGLENMGYVKKNWELLWVDPVDYADTLEKTVRYLFYRGMHVSIYNLQLCVLPKSLWSFARKSISDYKNIYLPECEVCAAREQCGGLFVSSEGRHSRGIKAILSL